MRKVEKEMGKRHPEQLFMRQLPFVSFSNKNNSDRTIYQIRIKT